MNKSKDASHSNQTHYKVKNWKVYNESLKQRGSLTLYIDQEILSMWKGVGHYIYSDIFITMILTLGQVYRKPLRQTEGFFRSLCNALSFNIPTPNYSTLCRRNQKLSLSLHKNKTKQSVSLIVDSTGVKVYGEGEWKVRKHGWNYRRKWVKVHLGIDTDGEIRVCEITDSDNHDAPVGERLIVQEKKHITDFYGDGAYDSFDIYGLLTAKGVSGIHIPPKKNAKVKLPDDTYVRDAHIKEIQKTNLKQWKIDTGYHQRSKVETTMYRLKKSFDGRLFFRTKSSQKNELLIQLNLLNLWRSLGYPEYVTT